MRLNGKAAIMAHLGRAEGNWRAWQAIKLRYGRIIYLLDRKQRQPRYWTMTEWLTQVDLESGHSVYDAEYERLAVQVPTYQEQERKARAKMRERELTAV